MADLIPDSDERGQLILLAGFILAIAFVILALVVNSAIFTENLATRDDVPGSQEALEYRDEVERSVGDVLLTVDQNDSLDVSDLEGNDGSIDEIAVRGGFDQSALGRIVDISKSSDESATKFAQVNENRNFTSEGFSQEDWDFATSVDQTRNVQFTITDLNPVYSGTEDFVFKINDTSGPEWRMIIGDDSGDANVTVDPPGRESRTCTLSYVDNFTIDVTGGTIDGTPCPALSHTSDGQRMWLGTGVDDGYTIEFENGNEVEGTYSFIADGGASVESANLENDPASGEPYYDNDATYSITVDYEFYTPNVVYETEITVAPGEVPP